MPNLEGRKATKLSIFLGCFQSSNYSTRVSWIVNYYNLLGAIRLDRDQSSHIQRGLAEYQ